MPPPSRQRAPPPQAELLRTRERLAVETAAREAAEAELAELKAAAAEQRRERDFLARALRDERRRALGLLLQLVARPRLPVATSAHTLAARRPPPPPPPAVPVRSQHHSHHTSRQSTRAWPRVAFARARASHAPATLYVAARRCAALRASEGRQLDRVADDCVEIAQALDGLSSLAFALRVDVLHALSAG